MLVMTFMDILFKIACLVFVYDTQARILKLEGRK